MVSGISRRMTLSYVPAVKHQHTLVQTMLHQLFRSRGARHSFGLDKLHGLHSAYSANISDEGVLPLPGGSPPLKLFPQRAGTRQ